MKLWPERVLGGSSPVQAIFRHSITVCSSDAARAGRGRRCSARPLQHSRSLHGRRHTPQHTTYSHAARQHSRLNRPGGLASTNRLARAVVPHDERERLVELDHVLVVGAEGADACRGGRQQAAQRQRGCRLRTAGGPWRGTQRGAQPRAAACSTAELPSALACGAPAKRGQSGHRERPGVCGAGDYP